MKCDYRNQVERKADEILKEPMLLRSSLNSKFKLFYYYNAQYFYLIKLVTIYKILRKYLKDIIIVQ